MAYNPFDFFRKNQKVLFAVFTVIIMFVFVLQFGQGDFFSWFPRQVAKWQTHGDVMAVIDGSQIKESQLADLSAQRRAANAYMLQASDAAAATLEEQAKTQTKGATEAFRKKYDFLPGQLRFFRALASPEDAAVGVQRLEEIARAMGEVQGAEASKPADKEASGAIQRYAVAVRNELARREVGDKADGGVYFTNQPDRLPKDRLDFMLWLKKADHLGIRYTHDDVTRLVAAEFPPAAFKQEELPGQIQAAAQKQGKKPGELLDALGDEFRVRAAQAAVIGVNEVRDPAAEPVGTTRDRLNQFLDETATTRFTFLSIPVEAYLNKVEGEPTRAELDAIYKAAVGTDADPGSLRPGIRDPRKVGVQWVEITGQEPYYEKLAAARTKQTDAALALFGVAVSDNFPTYKYEKYVSEQEQVIAYRQGRSGNPGKPSVYQEPFGAVGGGLAVDFKNPYAMDGKPAVDGRDRLLDAEVVRPEVLVSLVGLFGGGAATAGTPLAPSAVVNEALYRRARERSVLAGVRAFHFPLQPGLPELNGWLGGEAAVVSDLPKPLPAAAVQPVLDARTADLLRSLVATEDVRAFEKKLAEFGAELEKIAKEPAKVDAKERAKQDEEKRAGREKVRKEAAAYTARFIADRGLKAGGTSEPRDAMALADDSGMVPLLRREAFLWSLSQPKNLRAKAALAQPFLNEVAQFTSKTSESRQLYAVRVYDPKLRNERTDYAPTAGQTLTVADPSDPRAGPLAVFWRTDDIEPTRLFQSDPKATERCKVIWRWNKARELARKAADAAAADIQKAGEDEVRVRQAVSDTLAGLRTGVTDPNLFLKFSERTLPQFDAAKLLLTTPFGGNGLPAVAEYTPRDESIVYESEKMKDDLLANRDKPVGTTFVFTDRPETVLYLTVVAGRQQRPVEWFREYVMYPDAERLSRVFDDLNKLRQRHQQWNQLPADIRSQMAQFAPPPMPDLPLTPQALAPRFAASARAAARADAVSLLKAEFGYDKENPKVNQKGE